MTLATLLSGALSGTATAVVGVAGAALIGALYLLRLRRREVLVPFAPFWLGPAGEQRATRWARRLRHWLSLLLSLVIFGLVLLAAADLRPAGAEGGRSIVVLIDKSASMTARDGAGTRLATARAKAADIVAGLRSDDRALVASFAADAIAESGFESDRERLRRAALAVTASEEPGDLGRALGFCAAVLRGRPRPTIILVSDGGFPDGARHGKPAGIDLRYVPVGRRGHNAGIVSFAARRIPADPGAIDAALVVQNFGPEKVALAVDLAAAGAIVERLRFELAAGERRRHELANVFAPDARLEARLVAGDDLALDDRAFAVIPPLARRRVLVAGNRDLYLDGALLSLGRAVTIDRLDAAAAQAARERWPDYDLVIFNGVAPEPPPSEGRFLYLDPRGAGSPFPERGRVRNPVLAEMRRDHPLLRQLDLSDVNVAEARRLVLAPGDVSVAGSFGVPLIIERYRPRLRIVAISFDPRRSDLPMRPAFPLFFGNVLARMADRADAVAPPAAVTGGVIDPGDGNPPLPITRVGFHEVGAGPGSAVIAAVIAANLGDVRESDITPVPDLAIDGQRLAPPDPPVRHPRVPLPTLALFLAVGLLAFEWVSYHRRWTS